MFHRNCICVVVMALAVLLSGHDGASGGALPAGFEAIEIDVAGEKPARLKAYLMRAAVTASDQRAPAVIALHGCGGLFNAKGDLSARDQDWARHLAGEGYSVLFPDSFNPRGYREICRLRSSQRPIRPQHRADDASAALAWLAQQPFVDPTRIALIGWSNGGSSTLWAVRRGDAPATADYKTAIAFYPGCRPLAERPDYAVRLPLTILIGSADDWTPAAPCRDLATRQGVRLVEYPDAVHGFDAPNSPRRTRSGVGLSARGDGRVEIGTHPEARAAAIVEVRRILAEAFGREARR